MANRGDKSEAQDLAAHIRWFLRHDRSHYLPTDIPQSFDSPDSWSGARFLRWNAEAGPMLLKIWPEDGPTRADHTWRHGYLKKMASFRPDLALPLPDLLGRTLRELPGDSMAELFRWLPGEQVSLTPTIEAARDVAITLARIHMRLRANGLRDVGLSGSIQSRLARLRALEAGGFLSIRSMLRGRDAHAVALSGILPHLRSIFDSAEFLTPYAIRSLESVIHSSLPLQLVLRDVRPNHFLTRDSLVSGVVDFGALGFDTVALDLSRLLGEWFRLGNSQVESIIAAYESIRRLESAEFSAIEPLTLSTSVLGGLAWIDIALRRKLGQGRESALAKALEHAGARLSDQRRKLCV